MHCRDAKLTLVAQSDGDLAPSDALALQEHLKLCPACRAYQQHQHNLNALFCAGQARAKKALVSDPHTEPLPLPERTGISTARIMLAVQQHRRITQQLEDIHRQQCQRFAHLRIVGTVVAAIIAFTLASLPLLLLTTAIVQPSLLVKVLDWLSDIVSMLIVLAQYLQIGLTLVTRNNWLLSATALALVVMMGMWLLLMRHPQEA